MNILITGSGGREHALAWKLKQSPKVENIFIAPGNAGTSQIGTNIPQSSTAEIIEWAKNNPIDLVVVGPDNHLAEGMVDLFQSLNIPVFGPTKAAAEIEWSKSFAKQFMLDEGVPTASYKMFTDIKEAKLYVSEQKLPIVIKASGLALGKGVIIAATFDEATAALDEIMGSKIFGTAGNEVIIEEYLEGREISIHAFSDGINVSLFPAAQDHKRVFEGDKGPNTGGMGTIAPVPWVTEDQLNEIKNKVVLPTIKAMNKIGRLFKGILFPGIMITSDGPKVIEFNARFGDPETQSYMRILGTDLLDILFACINGNLNEQTIDWSDRSACCITCASGGYPGEYEKGKIISGLENINQSDVIVFHAGTKLEDGNTLTNGGRVLGVTSIGSDIKTALNTSYEALESISFDGMQYRKDIGAKSI